MEPALPITPIPVNGLPTVPLLPQRFVDEPGDTKCVENPANWQAHEDGAQGHIEHPSGRWANRKRRGQGIVSTHWRTGCRGCLVAPGSGTLGMRRPQQQG